jgi:hypothetical protein
VMKVNPSRQFSTSENSALGFSTTGMMSNPWQRKPLMATWRRMCLWVLKIWLGGKHMQLGITGCNIAVWRFLVLPAKC